MMQSLNYSFDYQGFEILIIGYEIGGGWRMAIELRKGSDIEIIRDTANVYPDFDSLRSMAIWTAHAKIASKVRDEAHQ
ncbi:hypothetical protein [Herbaspirillum rubrisubalbicans]|nr:hypothetical protein [Herbaspirillum rubrisubalbicans]